MTELDRLVDQAHSSELFSAPHLEPDLARFLREGAPRVREIARDARRRGTRSVFFVGAGGSWASMYSGKELCDRFTGVPADVSLSYELVWRAPRRLDDGALVFLASYSGATEDTLAAAELCRSRGARTVALVRREDSPLAQLADEVVAYDSPGLYCLPLAAVAAFACEWGRLDGNVEAEAVLDGLQALPAAVGTAYRDGGPRGLERAQALRDAELLYCLGAGPLYGLAYKFALTVFMENMRIHGSVIESAEFRHGPAEMLDRRRPDVTVLVGRDASRRMTERSIEVIRSRAGRVIAFDAADHPDVHPLLAAFPLKVELQWFIAHSAFLRGITDLDERVLMGHRVLAEGGATWP
ncbi:MAG TPA: SIS domain-containing protein [Gaiellales bacterium]|nr:SIS domain-containing protein [Gaiellales bacterium]